MSKSRDPNLYKCSSKWRKKKETKQQSKTLTKTECLKTEQSVKKKCEWEPFELDLDEYICVCLPIFIAFIAAINVIHLIFIFVHKMDKPQNRLMCVYARLWSLAVLPISLVVIIGLAPSSYLLGARTSFFCCWFVSVLCCGQRFFIWSAKKRSNTNYTLKYKKTTRLELKRSRNGFFFLRFQTILGTQLWNSCWASDVVTRITNKSCIGCDIQTRPAPMCMHFIHFIGSTAFEMNVQWCMHST